MDLYFNELSVRPADTREIGWRCLRKLVNIYKVACGKGFKGLKISGTLLEEQIAEDYTFGQWLNDPGVDRDTRLLFKTQFLKYPFIEDVLEQKASNGSRLYEFKYGDKAAKGLGAAFLFDSLALSLASDAEWDTSAVRITVSCYSEEEADIVKSDESVRHASRLTHFDDLEEWIRILVKKKASVPNCKILWLKRRELFPHLLFSEKVKGQVESLTQTSGFVQVRKRLFELEVYFANWKEGPFNINDLPAKITRESETRLNKWREKLTLMCEDGKFRLFSWHLRYTPGPGRIYVFPHEETRMCHVGYIGPKIQ